MKKNEDRVTIMFTCNATGSDKLNPLIIGTAENPRCFRNFRKDLYCDYYYNKKGWMNRKVREAEPEILQTANENTEQTENLYNRVLAALDEPTTSTFEQFAAFDEGVFTCESHIERTSNEELVDILDDTIESIEEPNIPTRKQALEAIELLQVYMEHSTESTGTSIDQLNSLRDVIKKMPKCLKDKLPYWTFSIYKI